MVIKYVNEEHGITEEYSQMELEFIKRSYEEYADREMTKDDFLELAKKIIMAKYEGSRYSEAEWDIVIEE